MIDLLSDLGPIAQPGPRLRSGWCTGVEAGVDEVGRGCLAGPVVACAVVLPEDFALRGLRDSKKMSERARESAAEEIRRSCSYGIGAASASEVDELNIYRATMLAMRRALDLLVAFNAMPVMVLVDGDRFDGWRGVDYRCVVRGDDTLLAIAAASVVAKVHRDRLMCDLAAERPGYGWEKNKGYGTAQHIKAIKEIGFTEYHRRTFNVPGI